MISSTVSTAAASAAADKPILGRHPAVAERLTVVGLSVLLVTLVACRYLWALACPIYDDAFITYRFARNLAEGLGMVFNPGAPWEPVLGTTAPGYCALLAGLRWLGADLVMASMTVNLIADVITAIMMVRLLAFRRLACIALVCVFAAMPDLGRISMGGMEAPVFLMLVVGATTAWKSERPRLSGFLAAISCSFRPEAIVLVGVLGLAHLFTKSDGSDAAEPGSSKLSWSAHGRAAFWRFMIPAIVVGLAYASFLTAIYDSPIPQSVMAKSAKHAPLKFNLRRITDILHLAFAPIKYMVLLLPVVILGLRQSLRLRCPLWPVTATAMLIVSAYLAVRPKTWGWYYYLPLTAWAIGLALGFEQAMAWIAMRKASLSERLERLALPLGVVFSLSIVLVSKELRPDNVSTDVYAAMQKWIAQEQIVERQASIMASDIGAIGYYADTQILDSMGLVWPEAVAFDDQLDVIRDQKPEYVLMVATAPRLVPFMEDEELMAQYEAVVRFNPYGWVELHPDLARVPGGWVQDYIIFERR